MPACMPHRLDPTGRSHQILPRLSHVMIPSACPPTSRELHIANRTIAGAPQIHSLVVKLPLADSSLFADDTQLSPAHTKAIHRLAGPQWLRRPLGRFIPGAYCPCASGVLDLPQVLVTKKSFARFEASLSRRHNGHSVELSSSCESENSICRTSYT
jgi:hypothetical protein